MMISKPMRNPSKKDLAKIVRKTTKVPKMSLEGI